jgi:sortase A
MSGWRWLERILLAAGVIAVDVWIWSNAVTSVSQNWQSLVFDHEIQTEKAPHHVFRPANRSLLGRLTIPRLHVSAMVREGTDTGTLQLAVGHIASTALPWQDGNVCLAAHRDTLFRPLRDIHKSDLIRFDTAKGTYMYRVESTQIVGPQDVEVLRASHEPELTLVTCYPFNFVGSAPDRFIVRARQVETTQGL